MKITTLLSSIAISSVVFLNGCSTVHYAPVEEKNSVINAPVPTGKASVFIIRGEKDEQKGRTVEVEINGKEIDTYGRTFKRENVSAGKTTIETDMVELTASEAEVTDTLVSGKKYYYELSLKPRLLLAPKATITKLSPAEAMAIMDKINFTKD